MKDMTAEFLEAAKANAVRQEKPMLVFLIDMALLEVETSGSKPKPHPAGIPQIPLKAA